MPGCARREIVLEGEMGVYHCSSRCVRRAFLCGHDQATGKNFDHRRRWVQRFEQQLAGLFGIEVAFHAEMSNHLHLVLRSRPDVVATWSDEQVARRYLTINLLIRCQDGEHVREPSEQEIATQTADPERMPVIRIRLASISKFMGALCEHIARRANREDGCRGRFFEGRFKCRRLEDEAAILVCGIYVDLNQIRAGEALTPEESKYTSAYQRILAWEQQPTGHCTLPADSWLCELTLKEAAEEYDAATRAARRCRASDKGLLPIRLEDYLRLLDWTGRTIREGKSGSIPCQMAPVLDRLRINKHHWIGLIKNFDRWFGHVVGHVEQLAARAAEAGRHWYQGICHCREAFG